MDEKLAAIKKFYEQAFQIYDRKNPAPPIEVVFYPYVGINQTIRMRDGKIFVRLAEICRDAPNAVQKSLAFILVAKMLRQRVAPNAEAVYREFVKSHEVQDRAMESKRTRGRKIITTARGEVYDLAEIFRRVNEKYFQNEIPACAVSWSAAKTFRRLGHHDAAHNAIIISKSLDSKKIPAFVVEFVVFHEMLHIFHPTRRENGRYIYHSPAFRRDEKKFEFYEQAEDWIGQNAGKLKRQVKTEKTKSRRAKK